MSEQKILTTAIKNYSDKDIVGLKVKCPVFVP